MCGEMREYEGGTGRIKTRRERSPFLSAPQQPHTSSKGADSLRPPNRRCHRNPWDSLHLRRDLYGLLLFLSRHTVLDPWVLHEVPAGKRQLGVTISCKTNAYWEVLTKACRCTPFRRLLAATFNCARLPLELYPTPLRGGWDCGTTR